MRQSNKKKLVPFFLFFEDFRTRKNLIVFLHHEWEPLHFLLLLLLLLLFAEPNFIFRPKAEVEGARIYFSVALNSAIAGIIVLPSRAEV